MPASTGVIVYEGKRGRVFRIKYADADGRQVMETLGPERDGWTEKKAAAERRERMVKVERRGWRKPAPLTFAEYAETWFREGEMRRAWKPRTVIQYRSIKKRLVGFFGDFKLAEIRPRDIAAYVAEQAGDFQGSTVSRDLSLLHDVFKSAKREELIETNPAEGAEHPKQTRRRWRILEPHEIALVRRSFTDEQARTIFLVLVLTGMRRHEMQQLRWRDVDLVDAVVRVRDSKTEQGVRSIALAPSLVEALVDHLARSRFKGRDELVFCHPDKGSRYSEKWFAEHFRVALDSAGIIDYVRPFHDLRHTSLTNEAASGSGPVALMAKAGHTDMKVTRRYLHLAGIVFHDEAEALERRLFGPNPSHTEGMPDAAEFSTKLSTDLSGPGRTSPDPNRMNTRVSDGTDLDA